MLFRVSINPENKKSRIDGDEIEHIIQLNNDLTIQECERNIHNIIAMRYNLEHTPLWHNYIIELIPSFISGIISSVVYEQDKY